MAASCPTDMARNAAVPHNAVPKNFQVRGSFGAGGAGATATSSADDINDLSRA
jgi:hypothetical protein